MAATTDEEKKLPDWWYQPKYQEQMDNLASQIENRPAFRFKVNQEALYDYYRGEYDRQGRQAQMDTQARGAGLTGGYDNSYARMAGQQVYEDQMDALGEVSQSLYDQAVEKYVRDGNALVDQYEDLRKQEEKDYKQWQKDYKDQIEAWEEEQEAAEEERKRQESATPQAAVNRILGNVPLAATPSRNMSLFAMNAENFIAANERLDGFRDHLPRTAYVMTVLDAMEKANLTDKAVTELLEHYGITQGELDWRYGPQFIAPGVMVDTDTGTPAEISVTFTPHDSKPQVLQSQVSKVLDTSVFSGDNFAQAVSQMRIGGVPNNIIQGLLSKEDWEAAAQQAAKELEAGKTDLAPELLVYNNYTEYMRAYVLYSMSNRGENWDFSSFSWQYFNDTPDEFRQEALRNEYQQASHVSAQRLREMQVLQRENEALTKRLQTVAPSEAGREQDRQREIYQDYGNINVAAAGAKVEYGQVRKGQEYIETIYRVENASDFSEKSKYNADITGKSRYDYVNTNFDPYMTERELAVYNYLFATEGEGAANAFLDTFEEERAQRHGQNMAEAVKGNYLGQIALKGAAGIGDSARGMAGLFTNEPLGYNAAQYAGMYVDEQLADVDLKWYNFAEKRWQDQDIAGRSLGQVTGDLAQTTGNMLPSMAVGGTAGLVLMGASAAGNAYQDMLSRGYTTGQAMTYGVLSGLSEAILEKALGGISRLGGGRLPEKMKAKLVKVDNVLSRFAKSKSGKVLLNAWSEAKEEAVQAILEPYFNAIVTGEEFTVDMEETLYSALMGFVTGGMFEGVNQKLAGKKKGKADAPVDTKAENMPGSASGGVETGVKTVVSEANTKKLYGEFQQELVTEALEINPENSFAQKMQDKLDKGKNLSGSELNKLIQQNDAAIGSTADMKAEQPTDMTEKVEASMPSQAVTEQEAEEEWVDLPTFEGSVESEAEREAREEEARQAELSGANVLGPWVAGALEDFRQRGSISYMSAILIGSDPQSVRKLTELTGVQIPEGDSAARQAAIEEAVSALAEQPIENFQSSQRSFQSEEDAAWDAMVREYVGSEQTAPAEVIAQAQIPRANQGTQVEAPAANTRNSQAAESNAAKTQINPLTAASKKYGAQAAVMESAYQKGQDVERFDREYKLAYDLGKEGVSRAHMESSEGLTYLTAEQKNTAYDSGAAAAENAGVVAEAVKSLGITGESAGVLERSFNANQITAKDYAMGLQEAYEAGKTGIPMKETGSHAAKLTDQQRQIAYKQGQKASGRQVAKQQAQVRKNRSTEGADTSKGKVHFDGDRSSLNKTQRASLDAMEVLAKALGVQIHVFESKVDEHGNHVGANGWYDPSDSSIHIDLHAGADGKGTMLFTVAHELTHFIKQWSPAKFEVLANFLTKQYTVQGQSISELVEAQQDKAARAGRELDHDTAYEEMVADSMESMLADGSIIEMMAELKQQDRGLWQKICDWFKDLTGKLRAVVDAYKGVQPDSTEGRMVADMKDMIGTLQALYMDALVDASENFDGGAEKNTTPEGGTGRECDIKLSSREENAFKQYAKAINSVVNQSISGKGIIDGKTQVKDIMPTGPRITAMVAASSGNAIDISQKQIALSSGEIWHEYKRHTQVAQEVSRDQIAFTKRQFQNAVKCIISPDVVETVFADPNNPTQRQSFAYAKKTDRGHYVVVEAVGGKKNPSIYPVMILQFSKAKWDKMMSQGKTLGEILFENDAKKLQALDIQNNKKSRVTAAQFASYEAIANTLRSPQLNTKVSQPDTEVKKKFSDRDSDGNQLSKEQQEYFKDSKARDEQGRLLVMYHGTSNGGFTVFDAYGSNFGLFGQGLYFTDNPEVAESYTHKGKGNKKQVYKAYLRITNPIDMDAEADIAKWRKAFVDEDADETYLDGVKTNEDAFRALKDYLADAGYYKYDAWETVSGILDSMGYDGITHIGGGRYNKKDGTRHRVFVAFEPEQVKDVGNTSPTSNPDIRFSLREPVERTKDLVAVHNLSEEKLLKSLKLGGLPMPSIAIIRAQDGHGEFGDISLVFGKDTVDPEVYRSNKLYSGDAWTPMYPKVDYKPSEKVLRKVKERISGLVPYEVQSALGSLMLDIDNASNNLDRSSGNMVEVYKQNDAMKYAYLKDTGSDISLPMKEADLYRYGDVSNAAVRYFSGKLVNGLQTVELYRNMSARDVLQDRALTEAVADAKNFDVLRTLEKGPDEYLKYERNPVFSADEVSFVDVDNFLSASRKLLTNGVQQTVDRKAAKELIRDAVDQTEYESWLEKLFSGVVEKEGIRNNKDYFTPSGNRRSFEALHYEHNLENVIKAMRADGEKGIGNGFGGASIFGASTTEYSSIEDMKQASDRLQMMPYEEYQELRKQFTDRFLEIVLKLPNQKNSFSATDSAAEVLTEAVAKYKTRSGIANYLRRELKGWATYSEQVVDDLIALVNDIRKMPTRYFEAKPRRAVSFEEVTTAIVPDSISNDLRTKLEDMGIKFVEYPAGDEEARKRALNSLEGVRFSNRDPDRQKVQEALEKENAKLREDVAELRELVKMQRQVTNGTKFTKTSVEAAARYLKQNANAKGDTKGLMKLLNSLYEYIASTKELTWEGVKEQAQEAVDWLWEHIDRQGKPTEYAQDILKQLHGARVYLDESQMAEAAYRFGSYDAFRKGLMGNITLARNASTSLDSLWAEMAEMYPDIFDSEISAADMPSALMDVIHRLRSPDTTIDYARNRELMEQDLLREIYDSYWRVSTLYTAADVGARRIDKLKSEHYQRMDKLKQQHRETIDRLKQEHQARLEQVRKDHRAKLEEKVDQVAKRYQDARKKNVEGRNKTEMRRRIRKTIRELSKLLTHGTKERNVKEGMKDFVSTAIASAEVLFTDEYTNEDMVRNGVACYCEAWESSLLDKTRALIRQRDDLLATYPTAKEMDEVVAGDLRGYEQRMKEVRRLERKISENMGKLRDVFVKERARMNEATVSSLLNSLAEEYWKLGTADEEYIRGALDENVHQHLMKLSKEIGGTTVKDMSLSQLEQLHRAYTMVLTTVRNANESFAKNLEGSCMEQAKAVTDELAQAGKKRKKQTKGQIARAKRSWNNLKSVYAFERLGSKTLRLLYENLRGGEDTWMVDMDHAREHFLKAARDSGYNGWDLNKQTHSFESSTGLKFDLNLGQIMSIYAYARRGQQALDHLMKGGFVFDKYTEERVTEHGIPKTYLKDDATAYNLSLQTIQEIIGKLTPEQRAFVETMQDYLSDTMGAKGNEVSMKLYGVKLFGEKFYFPLRSSGVYLSKAADQEQQKQQGQVSIKNAGFTHSTTPNATNPVVLSGFMDVWANHVNEMSMYHAFVLPMEDFNKVYNYSTPHTEEGQSGAVKQAIINAHGSAATDYINQFIRDLNGGVVADPREGQYKAWISKFKKASVIGSWSVVVQQATAITRAYSYIDPIYFGFAPIKRGFIRSMGNKVTHNHTKLYDELKKYAPVAAIKQMGRFDTDMGMGAVDYLTAKEFEGFKEKVKAIFTEKGYFGKQLDEAMGFPAERADEITWVQIWQAVKKEVADKQGLKFGSEEHLKAAGKRFTEVITRTQVYDSVFSRSANMRSKGAFMTMATSFMAEPTTTANMLTDAIREAKRGNVRFFLRVGASIAMGIILNNVRRSFVYAMWDDDEDETFIEKYLQAFASGMLDDVNPMSYLPFWRDVWSLAQGYDVERADMSVIATLIDAGAGLADALAEETEGMTEEQREAHDKKVADRGWKLVDSLASAVGLPVKNLRRDIMGAVNFFDTIKADSNRRTTAGSLKDKVWEDFVSSVPGAKYVVETDSKTDNLYDAIVAGDSAYVERLKSGYKSDDAYTSAVRKGLRENDGRIRAAAVAWVNDDLDTYMTIAKEVIGEGKFLQDDVVAAIQTVVNELTPDQSSSSAEKHKGLFNANAFAVAISQDDTQMAKMIQADIVRTAQRNGKTEEEAEKSFISSVTSACKKMFGEGELTEEQAINALTEFCDKDEDEAKEKVAYWEFQNANPQYEDWSQDTVTKYKDLEPDTAAHVIEVLGGLSAEDGYTGVRPVQKLEAIASDRDLSAKDKETALRANMDSNLEAKYDTARNMGISMGNFVKAYRKYQDTSGEGKKATVIAYYKKTFGISNSKAEDLYDLFVGKK